MSNNKKSEDLNPVLHILRNPNGYSEQVVREMRLKAADEIERLLSFEEDMTIEMSRVGAILERNRNQ